MWTFCEVLSSSFTYCTCFQFACTCAVLTSIRGELFSNTWKALILEVVVCVGQRRAKSDITHVLEVVPRLFTAHPHSYNNDLQTALWVTQRCYGMGTVVDLCRGQLLFPSHKRLFSLTKALIVETFEKNKNIFVSPIASFVNHCYSCSCILLIQPVYIRRWSTLFSRPPIRCKRFKHCSALTESGRYCGEVPLVYSRYCATRK